MHMQYHFIGICDYMDLRKDLYRYANFYMDLRNDFLWICENSPVWAWNSYTHKSAGVTPACMRKSTIYLGNKFNRTPGIINSSRDLVQYTCRDKALLRRWPYRSPQLCMHSCQWTSSSGCVLSSISSIWMLISICATCARLVPSLARCCELRLSLVCSY